MAFAVKLHLRTLSLSQHYGTWLYGFRNTRKSSWTSMIVAAASLPVEIRLFVMVPVAPKPLRWRTWRWLPGVVVYNCQRRPTRQSPTRHHASTPVAGSRAQPLASRLLQIVLHILCCRIRQSRTLANPSGLESSSIVLRQTPTNMTWHRHSRDQKPSAGILLERFPTLQHKQIRLACFRNCS